jgi:hypothetical protein
LGFDFDFVRFGWGFFKAVEEVGVDAEVEEVLGKLGRQRQANVCELDSGVVDLASGLRRLWVVLRMLGSARTVGGFSRCAKAK